MVVTDERESVEVPALDIEEMFTSLPISRIQKLRDEYDGKLKTAKSGLLSLVENKYRHLIHIADDIGQMYDDTIDLDKKLSSLSYKQSRFVGFSVGTESESGKISFSRKGHLAEDNAELSRYMLSYVLHKYLIGFNLRLSDGGSSITSSSECVYYAKIYYSVETILRGSDGVGEDIEPFESLKQNLSNYLEQAIASYNSYYISSYSNNNEKVNKKSQFNAHVVTNEHEFLVEKEEIFEEEHREDSDKGDGELKKEQKAVNQVRKCVPILNYLISYAILHSRTTELQSIDGILQRFTQIRKEYLSSVLDTVLSGSRHKSINFRSIFRYIINTINFAQAYFENERSDFFKYLDRATYDWKLSDLIDPGDWIKDSSIKFDSKLIKSSDSRRSSHGDIERSTKELSTHLFNFTKSTYETTSIEDFAKSSRIVEIFHQYITGILKVQDEIELNGIDTGLIDYLTQIDGEEIIMHTLSDIKTQIEMFYKLHFDKLISDKSDSIYSELIAKLATNSESENSLDLFPTDLTTQKHNRNLFIRSLGKFSNASQVNHLCEELCGWFNISIQLLKMIDQTPGRLGGNASPNNHLFSLISILERHEKSGKRIKFGSFSLQQLQDSFAKFSESTKEDLWKTLKLLVDSLYDRLSQNGEYDFKSAYFLLTVMTSFKEMYSSIEDTGKASIIEEINESFYKVTKLAYTSIFNHITAVIFDNFYNEFRKESIENCNTNNQNIPTRPSLKLSSKLYKLSSSLQGKVDGFSGLNYGYLYSNRKVNKEFIKMKNDWIQKSLVDPFLDDLSNIDRGDSVNKEGNENGKVSEESDFDDERQEIQENGESSENQQHYSQILTDILFLIQFTEASLINVDMPAVKLVLSNLSTLDPGIGSNIDLIIKGVCDFFKSKKYIYLPLSIN